MIYLIFFTIFCIVVGLVVKGIARKDHKYDECGQDKPCKYCVCGRKIGGNCL